MRNFVQELPEVSYLYPRVGKDGMTHVRLAQVSGEVLSGCSAYGVELRIDKNKKTKRRLG